MGKSLLDYLRNSGQLRSSSPEEMYMPNPVPSTDPSMDYLNYLHNTPNSSGMVSGSMSAESPSYSEISQDEPFSRGIRKALASARESVESRPKRRLAIDPEQKHRAFRRAIDRFSETYAQPTPDNIRPAKGFWGKTAEVARGVSAGMSTLDDETEKHEALSREIDKENWKRDLEERKLAASQEKHRQTLASKYDQQQQKLLREDQRREEAEYKRDLSERKLSLAEKIAEHKLTKEEREEKKNKENLKRVIVGARQILDNAEESGESIRADASQRYYFGKESAFHPLSASQKKLDAYGGMIKASSFKGAAFRTNKEFDTIITVSSFYTPEVNRVILDAIEQANGLLDRPGITVEEESDILDDYIAKTEAIIAGSEQPTKSSSPEHVDEDSQPVVMILPSGKEVDIDSTKVQEAIKRGLKLKEK